MSSFYWLEFFLQFVDIFSALLLGKIDVSNVLNMFDFFTDFYSIRKYSKFLHLAANVYILYIGNKNAKTTEIFMGNLNNFILFTNICLPN